MGWARELTAHEVEICRNLGEVVVFWNHVEQSFRILLQRATHIGGPDGRIWCLIAQLTPVQLKDAMIALSSDHAPERAEHLKHCAKLFDREREYRNHFVHGPMTFLSTENGSSSLASGISARGGSLRVKTAEISATELIQFRDRLGALQVYLGALLGDSVNLRDGQLLNELDRPSIAPSPVMANRSWWDVVSAG